MNGTHENIDVLVNEETQTKTTLESKIEYADKLRRNPTRAEFLLNELLSSSGAWGYGNFSLKGDGAVTIPYHSQVLICGYIVDFYFPEARLAVEVNGSIHNKRQPEDKTRDKHLRIIGVKVVHIKNDDIYYAFDDRVHWYRRSRRKHKIKQLIRKEICKRTVSWTQ